MTTGRGFIFNSGRRLEQRLLPAPRGSRVPENASRPSLILDPVVPWRLQNSSRPALISSWASLLCQESKGREKHRTRRGPQEPAASMRRWWPDGRGIPPAMQPDLLPGFSHPPSYRVIEPQRGVLLSPACEKVEGLAGQDAQNNRDKTVRNSTQVQHAPGSRCQKPSSEPPFSGQHKLSPVRTRPGVSEDLEVGRFSTFPRLPL